MMEWLQYPHLVPLMQRERQVILDRVEMPAVQITATASTRSAAREFDHVRCSWSTFDNLCWQARCWQS